MLRLEPKKIRPAKVNLRAQQTAVSDQQDLIDYLRGECQIQQKLKMMLRTAAIAKSDLRKLRREIVNIKMVIYQLRQKLTRLENVLVTEALKTQIQDTEEIVGDIDEEMPPDKIPDEPWVELTWGTA
ncbi:hypothetical protein EDC01DRAFT_781555 [Geopyxis carbonaria]|nr:hypothetical protein EDC01DRAFT_781555 [Geopyxis carbonaria]